jgi:ketosteroid isomerase-like protein
MRILCVLVLAALVAACGGEEPGKPTERPAATVGGDEGAVRSALAAYQAAVRASDTKAICDRLLSTSVTKAVEAGGLSCEEFVGDQVAKGGPRYTVTVRSVAVTGDRAVADIHAVERDDSRDTKQPLAREGGRWVLTK